MRRRAFITLVGGAAAAWPLAAGAQQTPFVVRIIGDAPIWRHFRDGMHDLGYTEGQNIKYEIRADEGEPDRAVEAAKGLASIPVDMMARLPHRLLSELPAPSQLL